MKRWALVMLLTLATRPDIAAALDPEASCATQDAQRREFKPGTGVLYAGDNLFRRERRDGEKVASCELRINGRTIFQTHEGGKIVRRGFFLEGRRSGRWIDRGSVTIYAAGKVIQEQPSTECDPVARIGLALTVYCPRSTLPEAMVSDFGLWDAAMTPKGLVFDVYSQEARTPDSKAAFDAFPEHSEINFAAAQFTGGRVSQFMCIRPGEKRLKDCTDLIGASAKRDSRGDVYPTPPKPAK
jgi:hypothetical protein